MTSPTPQQPPAVPGSIAEQQQEQIVQQEANAQSDELRLLAQELAKPQIPFDPTTIRKGVVTAFNSGGSPPTVTLNISGDTTTSVAGVRFIDSYSPTIGDTVLIIKQGADIVVLGHVAESASNWTKATLSSGFSHRGNAGGDVEYRRVFDNGSYKMQWRGTAARSSGTTIISSLPAEFRPSYHTPVAATRSSSKSMSVGIDFHTDGDVTLTYGDTSSHSHSFSVTDNAHTHTVFSINHSHGGATTNTAHGHGSSGGASVTISGSTSSADSGSTPSWVSFNGIEYFL